MSKRLPFLIALIFPCFLLAQQYGMGSYELEDFYETQKFIQLDGNEVEMIPYKLDDFYGFVEKDNPDKWLVDAQFNSVYAVYKDAAVVSKKNKVQGEEYTSFGLVDRYGKVLIPFYFDHLEKVGDLYHGLIFHIVDTSENRVHGGLIRNIYLDQKGEVVFEELAQSQKSFTDVDTIACFKKGETVRVRGASGKLWQELKVNSGNETAKEFIGIENNLLLFREDSESEDAYTYTGVDVYGKEHFKVNYEGEVERIVQLNPYLYIHEDSYSYWFFNEKGQYKDFYFVPKSFKGKRYHHEFYRDYYNLRKESTNDMGLINRAGDQLLDFEYDFVDEPIDEMVFCVPKNQKGMMQMTGNRSVDTHFGKIVDVNGKLIVDKIWTGNYLIERFSDLGLPIGFYEGLLNREGVALLQKAPAHNGREILMAESDEKVFSYYKFNQKKLFSLSPDILFAGMFSEGLAPVVNRNGALGFINRQGEVVIDMKYEFHADPIYPSPRYIIPKFIGGYAYIQPFDAYIDQKGTPYYGYTKKNKLPEDEIRWMEVRNEGVNLKIGSPWVAMDITLSENGLFKVGNHDNPNSRYVVGKYVIKDSLLLLNPDDPYNEKFRYYLDEDEFVIEKFDKEELILRTNYNYKARENRRYYFVRKAKFDQFSREEMLAQFAFTTQDSIKEKAYVEEKAALKELRKNDRRMPEFPGRQSGLEVYLLENIIYPPNHKAFKAVEVNFTINVDGKVIEVETVGEEDNEYTKEVRRLISAMPKWLPVQIDGRRLQHEMNLKIRFEEKE